VPARRGVRCERRAQNGALARFAGESADDAGELRGKDGKARAVHRASASAIDTEVGVSAASSASTRLRSGRARYTPKSGP